MEQLNKMKAYWVVGVLSFLIGCQSDRASNISTEEFVIKEGFEIELIAAEPLLDTPMAMEFDEKGRIWVVELPGYMRDIDGSDEELPDGKIVILEDENGDGIMDTRKVFIDSLKTPRAIALAYGGLLYTETPNLWWVPIEDDQPGERVLVDSLYVVGGNIEHQPNGLLYNIDNWFYSAKSNARYRRVKGEWLKEVTTFRGQWGITHDDEGRLFYNSNSNPLQGDFSFPNQLINNPYHKASAGVRKTLDPDRRLYPIQPTSVNRGYNDGVLDSLGFLQKFTSACGPLIYRGDQFPEEFYGNAFVCGPEANLIKRYTLTQENGRILAENAYESSEFLVSKDESFRPINLYNGLDGAMYVLDLRKGVIQHRAYMTNYLREEILAKRLDTVNRIGRIYRIAAVDGKASTVPDFAALSLDEWVDLLKHPNGKIRSFAQQQLIFKNQLEIESKIQSLLSDTSEPLGQIHALWTLEGLGVLKAQDLLEVANGSKDERVLTQILRFIPLFPESEQSLAPILEQAIALNHSTVDLQLSHILGQLNSKNAKLLWGELAEKYKGDDLYSEALISGISGKEERFYTSLSTLSSPDTLGKMLSVTMDNKKERNNEAPKLFTAEFEDGRTRGFNLYSTYCASCHGLDGYGVENLAPPIYHSEYISQSTEQLILIALHGLKGPIEVNGKSYDMGAVMPGIKDNPALNDQDIAAILSFVRNSLSEYPGRIRSRDIEAIRQKTAGQDEMFTAESLKKWLQENGVGE